MFQQCRLCDATARHFGAAHGRKYYRCPQCDAVFADHASLLAPAQERERYLEHRNDPTPEYEAFLARLAHPLSQKLRAGDEGLDFGCGPVPVMALVFKRMGFSQTSYDPFFFPDGEPLNRTYDFITCSETAEHFVQPSREFALLQSLLKPGGKLGVMTQWQPGWETFWQWHYPRDPTHVFFYNEKTFRFVARRFGWQAEFFPRGVVIFSS